MNDENIKREQKKKEEEEEERKRPYNQRINQAGQRLEPGFIFYNIYTYILPT